MFLEDRRSRSRAWGIGHKRSFPFFPKETRRDPGELRDRLGPGSAAEIQPGPLNNCHDGERREAAPFRQTPTPDRRL